MRRNAWIFLKGTKPEYAVFVTVGIGIMILGLAAGKIEYIFSAVDRLKDSLPLDEGYLATLIKMIGITYIGQFSARNMQRCRASGNGRTDRAVL